MRKTPLWFSVGSGVKTVGLVAVAALISCGQLWRPFLESSDCPENPSACPGPSANDAGVTPMPSPPDLAVPAFTVEQSGATQNLYGIWGTNFPDADDQTITHSPIWAVGASGTVLMRNSPAGTWKRVTAFQTSSTLYAVSGRNEGDVLAVGDMQVAAAWNGVTWTLSQPSDMGVPPPFLGVAPLSPSSYLAVGRASAAYTITNQSRAATTFGIKLSATDLTSVYPSPGGTTAYIGAITGEIYKFVGGEGTAYGLKAGGGIHAIWLRSATDGWAVGDSGLVLHFDGSSWALVMLPQFAALPSLRGVYGNAMGQVWAVGDAGTILYFDGSWQLIQDASRLNLHGVWVDPATGGAWIVGDAGLILHSGLATR